MGRRAAAGGALTPDALTPGTPAAAREIGAGFSAPDDAAGWYGPGSEAWRLNREAVLLLGAGPRALLLQIAHPLVAEGVAAHSTFRADPWGRLRATLRSYLTIVYGSPTAARREVRRLLDLHERIRGPVRDPVARARFGTSYEALDPELLLWVHATLVDSTMVAVDAWLERLDRDRRARFYAETVPVARAFGVPEALLPVDLDAFEAYLERMLAPGGPIVVSPTARELAETILRPPLGPLAGSFGPFEGWIRPILDAVPPAATAPLLWPALGLLPPRVRAGFGVRWGWRERLVAAWLVAAWRSWRVAIPAPWRTMPQALAAERGERAGRRQPATGRWQ
ncbi:MAG TPA: oxygenase MpaB family protein [Candidatus Binatia bacterium]|nr:oxygenase MpaB family protein [Candidatus Binatia bacterium]